jgi:hypothetical protein
MGRTEGKEPHSPRYKGKNIRSHITFSFPEHLAALIPGHFFNQTLAVARQQDQQTN